MKALKSDQKNSAYTAVAVFTIRELFAWTQLERGLRVALSRDAQTLVIVGRRAAAVAHFGGGACDRDERGDE